MKRSVNSGWAAASVVSVLTILMAAPAAEARRVEYVEEISRTIEVDSDAVFILTNTSGETEVTSWSRNEIQIVARKVVRARSTDEAKEYAQDLDVKVHKDGTRRVEVETEYPDWGGAGGILDLLLSKGPTGEVDYEITVPAKATVQIHSSSGDVSVEETGGDLTVSVTSGDVSVAEARGQLAVTATSGDIEVDDVRGDTEISATSGDVTVIGVNGKLSVGVTSGDIYCQDVQGPMELSGSSATVSVLDCQGNVSISTSSGDIEVSDHRGGVAVTTSSGYVELEIESLEDSECEVNATTGDVEVALGEDGSYRFVIDTVNGDIDVAMPEEMEVVASRNSLRAKYRGGDRKVRISTISGDIMIEGM